MYPPRRGGRPGRRPGRARRRAPPEEAGDRRGADRRGRRSGPRHPGADRMTVRGIRGAIAAAQNSRPEILARTRQLIQAMMKANHLKTSSIAAAFFTVTPDLTAEFPATAVRALAAENKG